MLSALVRAHRTPPALIALALACNTSSTPHHPPPSAEPPTSTALAAAAPTAETAPVAAAAAPSAETIAAAAAPVTVAAIGDSLTDPRSGGGGYLEYLRHRCPESRFDSFGIGGEMVNQMRARFERDLFAPGRPAYGHVIVFGGVNDLYSDLTAGRSVSKIQSDLAWMYARAKARGLGVVAITVAPWGGFRRYHNERRAAATLELNSWIRSQAQTSADHVVDAHALLRCGDPWKLCPEDARPYRDGIHFGPRGHEKLGRALHERVFATCR